MHEGDKPSPWRLPRIGIERETGQVACAAHDQYLCPSPAEADAPDRRVGEINPVSFANDVSKRFATSATIDEDPKH